MPVIWRRGLGALLATGALAALGLGAAGAASKPTAIQNGGTLVVGVLSAPGGLDPEHGGSSELYRSFCESLYDVGPDGTTVPMLASGPATFSKDKLTVTIPLRKGVLFNDGTPFNAQAAVATFERDLTTPGSSRAPILGPVTSVTASGQYAVSLHLSSPNVALGYGLTNERMQSPTQIANLGANFGSDPVCVGPFMFQNEVPGQSLTVVKSPYYYDKQDVHLDKIVFQYEPSDIAAMSALESGQIQALDNVPHDILKSVEQNGFRVKGSLGFGSWYVGINIGNTSGSGGPFSTPNTPIGSSPALRQAFELAIDRKTLNRVVFGGLNLPGCTPISPAADPYYEANIACTPYDPAQARKLVQQSDIQNPTVDLMYDASSVQNEVLAEFLQSEENAVGINVVLDPQSSATLSSRASAGNYQTYVTSSTPVKADLDWMRTALPAPIWGFSTPQWTIDMKNGQDAVNPRARRVVYLAALKNLLAARPVIYLCHILNRAAFSNALVGVTIYPDANLRVEFAGYKAT
jgi:peptide/nickel transport system substrate-binding protein